MQDRTLKDDVMSSETVIRDLVRVRIIRDSSRCVALRASLRGLDGSYSLRTWQCPEGVVTAGQLLDVQAELHDFLVNALLLVSGSQLLLDLG